MRVLLFSEFCAPVVLRNQPRCTSPARSRVSQPRANSRRMLNIRRGVESRRAVLIVVMARFRHHYLASAHSTGDISGSQSATRMAGLQCDAEPTATWCCESIQDTQPGGDLVGGFGLDKYCDGAASDCRSSGCACGQRQERLRSTRASAFGFRYSRTL